MAGAPSATAAPQGSSTAQAPSAAGGATPAVQSVVPFLRGSGKGKYKFYSKSGLTLTTATQDLGPIDVKAYDYMRSILITVTCTSAGGITSGSLDANSPFSVLTNISVTQPNGQTMYSVSSGYYAALIQKYGLYRYAGNDPRADPAFTNTLASTAPTFSFAFRIPFELDLRDALGALPNKDAAAPFQLAMTLNTLANVYPTGSPTTPTFTVEAWLEAYDQPPTILAGAPVQTTPPNMNTLQRWTQQNITITSGQFDARIRKLGNYIRMIIPVLTEATADSGTQLRTDDDWPDPLQIVLDEDVKDNISQADWNRRIWETWGYGGVVPATGTAALGGSYPVADTPLAHDLGVFPIQYCRNGQTPEENANLYLPTIESEDYLLRGSWGSDASKLTCLICEVLPQGNIFG
jgi:hypothetical protein